VNGTTHDQLGDLFFFHELPDMVEVALAVGPPERRAPLHGDSEAVGDGNPDSTVAHIERHDAHDACRHISSSMIHCAMIA
jgi:hypothetical protein